MKEPQSQYLVFTGLDGSMFDSASSDIKEISPALKLLRDCKIPLIATTDKTAEEVLAILQVFNMGDPFIVENGGAIYIPEDAFTITFNYQKTVDHYRVIELGIQHDLVLEQIVKLREEMGYNIIGLSEMSPEQASKLGTFTLEDIRTARMRQYSEPVIVEGEPDEQQRMNAEIERMNLRIGPRANHLMITGDHDEGSAVRFLVQLYREEFADRQITTIGLGDDRLNAPMLYAVDIPVLVRKPDGRFDEQVGRRGLRFTRSPGAVGWNQAIIALITGEEELIT